MSLAVQPTVQDLAGTNRSLANGMVVGPGGVSVELFKITLNGDPAMRRRLLDIVVCIFEGPQQWKYVIMMVLHKKKDRTECGNYRGISLVAHAGKILLNTIARRLSEYCERVGILLEDQSGFRLNRFTTDVVFVIRRLQELARNKQIPLYVCFPDLTKAYNFVERTLLWTILATFDAPQNIPSIPRWHASMRAARRQGMLGLVHCGTGPSSRMRARAPPVQHILRGGYKRGLHAFQGEQRHRGRFGGPEEENGGGRKQPPDSQSS